MMRISEIGRKGSTLFSSNNSRQKTTFSKWFSGVNFLVCTFLVHIIKKLHTTALLFLMLAQLEDKEYK